MNKDNKNVTIGIEGSLLVVAHDRRQVASFCLTGKGEIPPPRAEVGYEVREMGEGRDKTYLIYDESTNDIIAVLLHDYIQVFRDYVQTLSKGDSDE